MGPADRSQVKDRLYRAIKERDSSDGYVVMEESPSPSGSLSIRKMVSPEHWEIVVGIELDMVNHLDRWCLKLGRHVALYTIDGTIYTLKKIYPEAVGRGWRQRLVATALRAVDDAFRLEGVDAE